MQLPKSWFRLYKVLLVAIRKFKKSGRNKFQDVEVELYDLHEVMRPYFSYFNFLLVIFATASIVASEGFILPEPLERINETIEFSILAGFILSYLGKLLLTSKRKELIRSRFFEFCLFILLILFGLSVLIGGNDFIKYLESLFGINEMVPLLVLLTQLYLILFVIIKFVRAAPILISMRKRPTQMVVGTFLAVIIGGSLLLITPSATTTPGGLSYMDALFTSTSAVCVTGLIVVDTATYLSTFGQIVVLILIQAGGLGILTIATLFALYVSSGLGVGQMSLLKDTIGEHRTNETFDTIKRIIALTLIIEGIGAMGYYLSWGELIPDNTDRLYFAVFHAVSAFCNAGFSLFTNSLADEANALNLGVNITTMILIVTGGLGFTTLWELLKGNPNRRIHNWQFSVHTRLVLIVTFSLIILGTVGFLFLEWKGVLAGYSASDKVMISFFQSITTRTAGFNSIDIAALDMSTVLIFLTLMVIGASPASTGGGLKTTTIAVLVLSAWSRITGSKRVEFARRNISKDTVITALTIFTLGAFFLFFFTFLLTITEDQPFVDLLFEEFSAFATVGLSRGITPSLTEAGKGIIIVSMFIGRVGIITLALAFAKQKRSTKYKYPSESVIVA